MPNTHLSPSKSRRDLAGSLRGSRTRKHARLRHRRLQAERLEDRQLLATISGQVFNDLNADGLKDTGESGQSGWTVYLDADGNGQLGTGETSTTTADDGSYSFDGLAPGTYTVAEAQQSGWEQTYPVATAPAIERVGVASDGTQGNGASNSSTVSGDGRYVSYSSQASNLVPGDTNGTYDAFVYDRQIDTVERVSLASSGEQGNDFSYGSQMSADGRYVVVISMASNLVPGDTNGTRDHFVYDRQTDTIERVSVADDGTEGNGTSATVSISADGRYVAFDSLASNLVPGDTNGTGDVFVYDRQTDTIEQVSVASDGTHGDGHSTHAKISADGRYVAFRSASTNLVPGDTNGAPDIFVYDRQTDTVERVSLATDGTQGNGDSFLPSISADGRYVAFRALANNLVPGDTNGKSDIFVDDRQTHSIERVSLAADGTQGNGESFAPSVSSDGRYVAFYSDASNLVPGDSNGTNDVFVVDRQTDMIERVSMAADGTQGNGSSIGGSISADGRYVGLTSEASNLVSGDTNGVSDVFVTANPFAWPSGSHVVVLAEGQDVSGINFGNASPTKFYVVNDATQNLTYEYNNSGTLLGSWTAGTMVSSATVEGIATNGTDVWIVDAKSDKVYKYANAAGRTSGSQNAASSFSLNSGNKSPKDIVTNGVNLWVVDDSTTDKVFKYTTAGALVSSWTITTSGATSPTGITIDPANVSNIWIVDSGTDRVYQYNAAATFANGSSHVADVAFALAAGNTNPQGIADPPAPGSLLANETPIRSEPVSAEAALRGTDAALASTYYEPLKKVRIDTVQRSAALAVEESTRDLSYTVGASTNRITDDSRWVRANHRQAEVDDLFAQWDSDPLQLLSFPDLGI